MFKHLSAILLPLIAVFSLAVLGSVVYAGKTTTATACCCVTSGGTCTCETCECTKSCNRAPGQACSAGCCGGTGLSLSNVANPVSAAKGVTLVTTKAECSKTESGCSCGEDCTCTDCPNKAASDSKAPDSKACDSKIPASATASKGCCKAKTSCATK